MARARLGDDEARIVGRVAYYEPLLPAPVLAREAKRLRCMAFVAERGDAADAESLFRRAVERFVDAFLIDRVGHASCFTDAHVLGRHMAEKYGCPMTSSDDGYWTVSCGVLALHQRLGLSFAGPTLGRCSVCGADDFQCDHLARESYEGVYCYREVYRADPHEVSVVQFPEDPRCYRLEVPRTPKEVRQMRGRSLRRGEVPVCTHCAECHAVESGPSREDLDQSLWPSPDEIRRAKR
jgi:hypothetical protein